MATTEEHMYKSQSELRAFLLDPATTQADIQDYWITVQREKRAQGLPHYTQAYDSKTGKTLYAIE